MNTLMRLVKEEQGQGMAEYGLILAGVALVVIIAIAALGDRISTLLEEVKDKLVIPEAGAS